MAFEGIYTVYLTGTAGQAMAMFVFKDGKIGGADMAGLVVSGSYSIEDEKVEGFANYRLAAGTMTITGATITENTEEQEFPVSLPVILNPEETYRIETPLGPLNAKFVKCTEFE